MKVLVVDNFDSFTLNIAQYLYEVTGVQPLVVPNTTPFDALPLDECGAVVLSPGPGRPSRAADFGVCREIIARCALPLLGVCLGHQGIAEFFGGRTVHAPAPAHGVVDTVAHLGTGLFAGLPQDLPVVRYHSLVSTDLPDTLERTAWTRDGLVMAVTHRSRPVWGVQFHPESVESAGGHGLLANFVALAARHHAGDDVRSPASPAPGPAAAESASVAAFRRAGGSLRMRLQAEPFTTPDTPADFFHRHCAGRPHAFWLDSEGSEHPGSRYSLMGAWGEPGDVALGYDLAARRLTLRGPGRTEEVTGDVFALLEDIVDAVEVTAPADWPLPFRGGLVGWFGYELKALTTGEERHTSLEPEAWFLHTRAFTVFDHARGVALDCRLVPEDAGPGHGPDGGTSAAAPDRLTAPEAPTAATSGAGPGGTAAYTPGPVSERLLDLRDDRAAYLAKIKESQRLITDGESYEICLTNRAELSGVGAGLPAYTRMRTVSAVPRGAYLRAGDVEVLCSSPETFLRVDESRVVESRPIKGTRPRGATPQEDAALREDLRSSRKDRAENLMIVDLVRHDLNSVCVPGSVHVPQAFAIESYSSVHQLVSTVRGRLRRTESALSAVRACFPGGSMTGAPKKRTMEIIDELEGEARGVYSGALGWLSFSGALDLNIVIRTAVVRGGTARFGVGGAITSQSDPDEEYEETLVKASVPYFGLRGWQRRGEA
ncbi:aminodeoxychorismate synthase component I [Streptomyces hilarionis]|uniref:aminodeoxychorismate synthase component I n=1 Tax=Streptomyces hilarionis TaxID=2839954 RepID=UPI00211A70AD|nr:aminodeoxychorismate synthase component I [Streptomyces hilarionis]MCQ9131396.1 aminodeoxychorismate synthase component I [Streptomyces hilarionis]